MKKNSWIWIIIAIIVVALIIVGVVASRNSSSNNVNEEETNSALEENTNSQNEATETGNLARNTESTGKILVAYFSGSNHTKTVAERIASDLNADIFVIEPEDEYTSDDLNYNNDDSRVVKEYKDESLRNVELKTTEVPNWDDYDTVFIGYPIWWGIAAWPTDSFVKSQDFADKTVIPFCTSYSSGLGQSAKNLENEAKGGNWQEGHRFSQNVDMSDVDEWVNSLGL